MHVYPPISRGSSPHTRGAQRESPLWRLSPWIIPAYAGSTPFARSCPRSAGDHPRIRGEHSPSLNFAHRSRGSSPHTRGAQGVGLRPRGGLRIIPAYAGSTRAGHPPSSLGRDHPRIRGEHIVAWMAKHEGDGSSPHTRGAQAADSKLLHSNGIIPAYAGSTPGDTRSSAREPDHPRIRGEHAALASQAHSIAGSSPHTRGAHRRHRGRGRGLGIIPAYAGSTGDPHQKGRGYRDHPRIRGEHIIGSIGMLIGWGSSPHTRGAHWKKARIVTGIGIIPAYAGSTPLKPSDSPIRSGSSPHTRGAHHARMVQATPRRIIPAYAGSTLIAARPFTMLPRIIPAYAGSTRAAPSPATPPADHPRIRGEHGGQGAAAPGVGGSSPHTRGARLDRLRIDDAGRIIPAYAGSTRPPSHP